MQRTARFPLTLGVIVAAVLVLTGCSGAETPTEAGAAPADATQAVAAEAGWADGYALADVIDGIPSDAQLLDTKGSEVARDAENYTVVSIDESASPVTVNVTRAGWEQGSQLVDYYVAPVAPDVIEIFDTAGNAVAPTAVNYVVLNAETTPSPETASVITTLTVEPNRDYDATA